MKKFALILLALVIALLNLIPFARDSRLCGIRGTVVIPGEKSTEICLLVSLPEVGNWEHVVKKQVEIKDGLEIEILAIRRRCWWQTPHISSGSRIVHCWINIDNVKYPALKLLRYLGDDLSNDARVTLPLDSVDKSVSMHGFAKFEYEHDGYQSETQYIEILRTKHVIELETE